MILTNTPKKMRMKHKQSTTHAGAHPSSKTCILHFYNKVNTSLYSLVSFPPIILAIWPSLSCLMSLQALNRDLKRCTFSYSEIWVRLFIVGPTQGIVGGCILLNQSIQILWRNPANWMKAIVYELNFFRYSLSQSLSFLRWHFNRGAPGWKIICPNGGSQNPCPNGFWQFFSEYKPLLRHLIFIIFHQYVPWFPS